MARIPPARKKKKKKKGGYMDLLNQLFFMTYLTAIIILRYCPMFMQLVDNLSNMGKVYEGVTENMKKLAKTFKHETDGANRRMKVHEELIFARGGLTDEEIVKVGGIITADCNKTDYLFTLRGHFKKLYVYSLLSKEALVM
jgi:hypothetical protein